MRTPELLIRQDGPAWEMLRTALAASSITLNGEVRRAFLISGNMQDFTSSYCTAQVTHVLLPVHACVQPALLYIVPATLGTVVITAATRGELKRVWDFTDVPSFGPVEAAIKKEKEEREREEREKREKNGGADKKWWQL